MKPFYQDNHIRIFNKDCCSMDSGTRVRAPRGKIIHIGPEEMEVWPWRCVDGHRCIQCYFIGKTGCAPRFWLSPTQSQRSKTYPLQRKTPEVVFSLDEAPSSGRGTLSEFFAAHPLEPLNDGGFTEEITERIKNRESELFRTPEPYRIIDEVCKCGYQYSLPWGTRGGRQRYFCPRCKRYWSPSPCTRGPKIKTAVSYGTCLKCGAANQGLSDGLCPKCYDRASVSTRLSYRHKSQGLCIDCTQPALQPHTRCPRCLERHFSYYHNHWKSRRGKAKVAKEKKDKGVHEAKEKGM